jgi:hypothetical protein
MMGLRSKKRKVRTPKGSEPANGGASEGISNLKFQIEISEENPSDDDKCNRE